MPRKHINDLVTVNIRYHRVLLMRVPEQKTEDQSKVTKFFITSASFYCTAELLLSRGRLSSVVRPSIKPIFIETVMRINTKFGGKLPAQNISRPFFLLLVVQIFKFFFCFR